ncbi:C-terminal domain of 1-Cys peroxiredoxin [Chytriomyces hyalinus]|nr:C-terminal domain of 1-Cys peroxiredoxin [Chytriomyces hyalinus]
MSERREEIASLVQEKMGGGSVVAKEKKPVVVVAKKKVNYAIELMKMKSSAKAMFFHKDWSVGKLVDKLATVAKVSNVNNTSDEAMKLALYNAETGNVLPMNESLAALIARKEIQQAAAVALERVSVPFVALQLEKAQNKVKKKKEMGPKRKASSANENARKKTLSEIAEPESIPKTPTTQQPNMTPKLNHPAPQFDTAAVVNKQFKDVKLSDYKGQWVVLFFYPLDFTFVCPTEIIAFSEAAEEFKKINTQVIGCSVDSKFSHLAWINQSRDNGGLGEMKIPLLADVKKEIATAYGVLKEDEGIAYRGTFIIDPKQNLRQITINDLDVGRNVEEVKRLVDAFQFHDEHGDVCPVNWKKGGKTMKADVDGSKEYFQAAYKQ